ncbi:MAG: exopolysaccharide biosynthesis protein [Erythrobacter sp.]
MTEREQKNPEGVGDVVEGLDELAKEDNDEVCFGDVLDKFGSRSFAPLMMVFALIELSPIGAIPGVPTFLAVCIAIVAVQLLIGREHIWVPGWIENRSISNDKMSTATDKMSGIADKLDSIASNRLSFMTSGKVAAAVILLLCIAVAPLELLPWASAAPMTAIAIISLGLMVRDGLVMLIAYIVAILATTGGLYYFFGTGGSGGSGGDGGGFLFF